jgi:hypothetical protein
MMLGKEHLLYKGSRTTDKGLCCSWGLDVGLSDLLTSRHSVLLSNDTCSISNKRIQHNVAGMVMSYGLDGPGFKACVGNRVSLPDTCPDRP